jgi:filamentous hemagglutinin family protein
MQRAFNFIFLSTFPLAILGCLIPLSTQAQVTPDGTTSTTVNQDGNDFTIEQGNRVGDNLFHSFNQFSVPTLGSAAFNNARDIANIFSRVTGSSISSIDGLISANGTANLFLINPNGIIFGENASLNLGGSFFASTADSLLFEGNQEFSAVNPQAPPLLEVSIPIGANFRDNPSPITIEKQPPGSADFEPAPSFDDNLFGLRVPDGKSFALAGGDITADGGGIVSVGGRIELGAVGEGGVLGLNIDGDSISFDFSDDLSKANVSLTNNAGFLVSGSGGGDLVINASNINVLEGSDLFAGIFNGLGSPNAQAANIVLNATNLVNISNGGSIQNIANIGTLGNGGDINIITSSLSLTNAAQISAETYSSGKAGNLTIDTGSLLVSEGAFISTATRPNSSGAGGNLTVNASKFIELNGTSANEQSSSGLYSTTLGTGDAGNLSINTPRLIVRDGATASALGVGTGNAGNILVEASDYVNIFNGGSLDATSTAVNPEGNLATGTGSGGNITIQTGQLNLQNGSGINTSTVGEGNAGALTINATDFVNLDTSSNLFTASIGGSGGDISIKTKNLSAQNNSSIASIAAGQGNPGDLSIETTDAVNIFSSSAVSTSSLGIGAGGSLSIKTQNLKVSDNAGIFTSTFDSETFNPETFNSNNFNLSEFNPSNLALFINVVKSVADGDFEQGNSGNLTINATETVNLSGGGFLTTSGNGKASGGSLSLNTARLFVTEGASIRTSTFTNSFGRGGDLTVIASETTELVGTSANEQLSSGLTSATLGTGDAGDLTITTPQLIIEDGAAIVTSTFNQGQAGNLTINATNFLQLDGTSVNGQSSSRLTSETFSTGDAGNLDIDTQNLFVTDGAFISSATRSVGKAGAITINATKAVELAGTGGLFVTATSGGNAGNLDLNTGELTIADGASVSVSSPQGQAGNLNISVNSLSQNQGQITALTRFNTIADGENIGANINLEISDIWRIENESIVSATAFGDADGGNININTDPNLSNTELVLLAFPSTGANGSDISANAENGDGGRIDITAAGIFGIDFRDISANEARSNSLNDFTVSSQFGTSGETIINRTVDDPTSGLINLPASVGDASDQISQNPCQRGVGSEFIVTGKGGLPPTVNESLNSESAQVGLIETVTSQPQTVGANGIRPNPNKIRPNPSTTSEALPAQGWVFNDKGEVTLTAYKTTNTGRQSLPQTPINSCSAR